MKHIILILLSSLPLIAEAQFANTAFFKVRTRLLAFSTAAQTVYQGNCSGMMTVQSRNGSGAAQNVTAVTPITLTSTLTTSYFSDPFCRNAIASVSIPNGQNSVSFYFVSSVVGTNTITANATGFKSGSQNESVLDNPFVWVGLGGDANWSTGLNWKGGTPPNNTQIAVFNSTCSPLNCSPVIDINIDVLGIRMEADYSGTITQGPASSLIVRSLGFLQYGGNFIGATNEIAVLTGSLFITAGTFTSTSGILRFSDARGGYATNDLFIVSNPSSFLHNNGTISFNLGSNNQPNHEIELAANNPLNDIRFYYSANDDATLSSLSSPSRPVVLGTATLENGALRGQWEFQGNLVFGAGYGIYLGPETAQFFFTGNSNQTINNTVGVATPRGHVTINKGATSKISFLSNYTLTGTQTLSILSGRVDLGTYTLTVPATLNMSSGSEIYLNAGVLRVGAATPGPGPYGSGTIISGASP